MNPGPWSLNYPEDMRSRIGILAPRKRSERERRIAELERDCRARGVIR